MLRGFALCGVVLANIRPILKAHAVGVPTTSSTGMEDLWIKLFIEQRFFPIFSLLFGIGFSLLLNSAAGRSANPRLLLVRRLLALLAVGLAHNLLLWQGDVLTIYAVVGLLVLLPATWLPRWAVAACAAALVAASLIVHGGGVTLVPGLFLLGSALTRFGVIDWIDRNDPSTQAPAVLGLIFMIGAVPALCWQTSAALCCQTGAAVSSVNLSAAVAGLLLAGAYTCMVLVLLGTPVRSGLRVVFGPLGRMALTNYLTATVLVLAVRLLLDTPENWSSVRISLIAGAILLVQWFWSTCWLIRYQYGPVEWLWRWVTWARRPPLRPTR